MPISLILFDPMLVCKRKYLLAYKPFVFIVLWRFNFGVITELQSYSVTSPCLSKKISWLRAIDVTFGCILLIFIKIVVWLYQTISWFLRWGFTFHPEVYSVLVVGFLDFEMFFLNWFFKFPFWSFQFFWLSQFV